MTIRHPIYVIYGVTLIGAVTWAEANGINLRSLSDGKATPRSVRDNPGAGRAIYGGSPRYSGGK